MMIPGTYIARYGGYVLIGTVREIADELQVRPQSIYTAIRRGSRIRGYTVERLTPKRKTYRVILPGVSDVFCESANEAAEYLDMDPCSVYRLARSGGMTRDGLYVIEVI